MPSEFAAVFSALKSCLMPYAASLSVATDTPQEYALVTRSASPFPQHKGHPLAFASVRRGKAYVSFHMMPVYMSPALAKSVPAALKKRMQGKSCFNFKTVPPPEVMADLARLTQASLEEWRDKKWL
jgi:hypothetical protein